MPLYDQQNRIIDYLRISVTDRCNLSCVYCKPKSGVKMLPHAEVLRYEEMLRVAAVAASLGIARLRVTGGEPLVRRGVIEFIERLRCVPGIEEVSVTTNGVMLAGVAAALFRAGVKRLNVSLDTLRKERFARITGRDSWPAVWKGIETAEGLGFHPVKINMVPVRGMNDDEIADFARLTIDRGLHVRFIEFMPIGAGDRWKRDESVPVDRIRAVVEEAFGTLVPFTPRAGAGPSDNYQISGARGVIGFISPLTKHFCASCRRLRLTPDGRIRPCLLSDTEIDIKAPLRAGCGDAELERLLRLALQVKPERHRLEDVQAGPYQRTMSAIGG